MKSRLLGGILLVVGTSIGAGILALPVATAELGFFGSLVLLLSCWVVMTICAFLFLEVNLWLPPNTNLISMAGATLGKSGQAIAWLVYLLLLYSILSAYIAGGGDLVHYILKTTGIAISPSLAAILFTLSFGIIVYFGIRLVDYVNRGLMLGKMGALIILVLLILPFISMANLGEGEFKHIYSPTSISVTIAAFTCAMIIPSLRSYFNDDIKTLRKAIFFGMLIPLICYIFWDMAIMGVIPLNGSPSLKSILNSSSTNSDLLHALNILLDKSMVTTVAKFFTSICMATSFLSISLSLSDFLSDGLNITKKGMGSLFIFGITFFPPLLIVLFYPGIFIKGLSYAGLSCFILMMLMPPLMVWSGRYYRSLANNNGVMSFQVGGGKFLLASIVLFSLLMIIFAVKGLI